MVGAGVHGVIDLVVVVKVMMMMLMMLLSYNDVMAVVEMVVANFH